jgi:hypothetical protein
MECSFQGVPSEAQFCVSGMFIPDPYFDPSRIQQQQQKRRGKELVVQPFFVATIITKIIFYFIFELVKKII